MKKIDLSNVVSGVRKLGGIKQTFEHLQEANIETIAAIMNAFIAGAGVPVSISGVVNSGGGSVYNISAGTIYHNGEVFDIPTFSGTAPGAQVPVLSLITTYRAGDPVKYSDSNTFNTHAIRKYQWSFGASGSGLADFSVVQTLKSRINDSFLDVDGQIAALVASAPSTLDTLNELAAALANDPNFATTITTALGLKAPLASPNFTGVPTAPTPSSLDNSTKIATTAFIATGVQATKVSKVGDSMTGNLMMGGNTINNVGAPAFAGDATNKTYVDTGLATEQTSRISGDNTLQLEIDAIVSGTYDNGAAGTDTGSGGGDTTILTIPIVTGKNILLEVSMSSRWVSGSAGAGNGSGYRMIAEFKNPSGTVSLISTATTVHGVTSGASAPILKFTPSGSDVLVQVTTGSGEVYKVRCKAIATVS